MSDTEILTDRGTAADRSRHKGAKRFHPLPIDVQLLGLEMMALRQYQHTWVKGTIGFGEPVSETKAAHNAMTSGWRRLTGRRKSLSVITLCRTSLAHFSRVSTWRHLVKTRGVVFDSPDSTLAVNVATNAGDAKGMVD